MDRFSRRISLALAAIMAASLTSGADCADWMRGSWGINWKPVARVASVGNSIVWAKGGVMFRDTLDADSMQWRGATGGGSSYSGLVGGDFAQ